MSDCSSITQIISSVSCQEKLQAFIYTELVLFVALLFYLLTIIGVSVFKHKVSGFTLQLLIMLTICIACNLIPLITILWIVEAKPSITANVNVIKVLGGLIIYIGVISGSSVYWIFAIKYWSVALKIELAIEEQDIKQHNKLTSWLMFGGIGVLLVLAVSATLQAIQGGRLWITLLLGAFMFQLFVSCFFIADALRRLARTKVENKTISVKMTVLFLAAYVLEIVGILIGFFHELSLEVITSTFVAFGLILGVLMLSTILYLIGISAVTSDLTNSQEAFDVQQASLLDEDWPENENEDLSFDQLQKQHQDVILNVEGRNSARNTLKLPRTEAKMMSAVMRNRS